jgi:hypothetical protein
MRAADSCEKRPINKNSLASIALHRNKILPPLSMICDIGIIYTYFTPAAISVVPAKAGISGYQ